METKKVESYRDIFDSKEDYIFYYKDHEFGFWYLHHPEYGFVNILNHTIEENKNGTITIIEPIIISNKLIGRLSNGVWQQSDDL